MKTPLETAQVCFRDWIGLIDGLLRSAETSFDKAVEAGQAGDAETAAHRFLAAKHFIGEARAEIAISKADDGKERN